MIRNLDHYPCLADVEMHLKGRGVKFSINRPSLDAIGQVVEGRFNDGRVIVSVFPQRPLKATLGNFDNLDKFARSLLPPEKYSLSYSQPRIVATYEGNGLRLPMHRFEEYSSPDEAVNKVQLESVKHELMGRYSELVRQEVLVVVYHDQRLPKLYELDSELREKGRSQAECSMLESLGWWVVHGEVLERLERNRGPKAGYFRKTSSLRLAS